MNVKIVITLLCSAIGWNFFVSAEGELKQCSAPFVSREIYPDNVTVTDCKKNEPCTVEADYTSIDVIYNLIAPCDTDLDIKKLYCKVFVTFPSKNYTSGCSKNFVSGTARINPDNAPEVKKGDKFSFSCGCIIINEFKPNETGTFWMELLMNGENGTDGWCASQGLKSVTSEEFEETLDES